MSDLVKVLDNETRSAWTRVPLWSSTLVQKVVFYISSKSKWEKGYVATRLADESAIHRLHMTKHASKEIQPSFETQSKCHQMPKTKVSIAQQKHQRPYISVDCKVGSIVCMWVYVFGCNTEIAV